MAVENGEWIMRGPAWEDPACIHSWQELVDWIDKVGFLPLFRNGIDGFSAEERTCPTDWWSGDVDRDPWEWRQTIARSGRVASPPPARRRSWTSSPKRTPCSPMN